MLIEIYKREADRLGKLEAIRAGWFNIWTPERIRGAFAFGHGTMKDFERYKRDNAPRFCYIVEMSEADLLNLYPEAWKGAMR